MALIPALVSLLLGTIVYAAFIKTAARIYRHTMLSWKSAFGFGALAMILGTVGTVANAFTVGKLPLLIVMSVGLGLQILVGAWFLGTRATNAAGHSVGMKTGAAIVAIAVAMAFAIGFVLAIVVPMLVPK